MFDGLIKNKKIKNKIVWKQDLKENLVFIIYIFFIFLQNLAKNTNVQLGKMKMMIREL